MGQGSKPMNVLKWPHTIYTHIKQTGAGGKWLLHSLEECWIGAGASNINDGHVVRRGH